MKNVFSEGKSIAFVRNDSVFGVIRTEEVLHHNESLGRRNHRSLGIDLHKTVDIRRMIRLHMLNHEIIGLSSVESAVEIIQPFVRKMSVHGIHNGYLFVHYYVRIIRNSVFNGILTFKNIYLSVVYADI